VATIVIHAGMPKTGSTSIQLWLAANSRHTRKQGFTVIVAPRNDANEIAFTPFENGPINSGWIGARAIRSVRAHRQLGGAMAEALEAAAERYGNVVVSGERLAPLFGSKNLSLPALQRLSMRHEVRVAYYVRPQHTAMDALWREFGWRTGMPPSAFFRADFYPLHYATARAAVRALAPGVRFELRPFRRDLLESGDVVADFVGHFLGVAGGKQVRWANRGLPLDVVNLLRASVSGEAGGAVFNIERLRRCYELMDGHELPEDDRTALSRRILQKHAYEVYGAENAKLGWADLVPPPQDPQDIPGLATLDALWEPRASPAELAILFRLLDVSPEQRRSLDADRRGRRGFRFRM
jgi:hypothetical protein